MKHLKWILYFMITALLTGCITGSSGGNSTGTDQLVTEAAAMGRADLEAMVAKYKGLISEKMDVAGALKAKLKEIPLTEMMGEKATALKQDLSETTALISQLKDKLSVYTSALKKTP